VRLRSKPTDLRQAEQALAAALAEQERAVTALAAAKAAQRDVDETDAAAFFFWGRSGANPAASLRRTAKLPSFF
jgi:hypothetical protein